MKILFAIVFLLGLPASILCQNKFEASKLTMGSFWKFENAKKQKWIVRVVAIKDDGYLIRTGKNFYGIYDRESLNILFLSDKEGNRIEKDPSLKEWKDPSLHRKLLNFPLFVGKTWEDSFDGWNFIDTRNFKFTKMLSYKVENYEEVVTPTGPLKAFRILMKLRSQMLDVNQSYSGEARFWVSPEANWWIKREYYSRTFWELRLEDAILIQYQLKK